MRRPCRISVSEARVQRALGKSAVSCASAFTGVVGVDETQPGGDAQHVAIHGKAGHAKRVSEHDVGGLAAHARQLHERVHVGRHRAAVLARRARSRGQSPRGPSGGRSRWSGRALRRRRAPPAPAPPARDSAQRAPASPRSPADRWTAPTAPWPPAARTPCGTPARCRHRDGGVRRRRRWPARRARGSGHVSAPAPSAPGSRWTRCRRAGSPAAPPRAAR